MFNNEKGMIGLVSIVIGIVLSAIASSALLNYVFHAGSFSISQGNNFQDYHNAAFGASRGIWLLKEPSWMAPGGVPRSFPYSETIALDANNTINITVSYDTALATYTIVSTCTFTSGQLTRSKALAATVNNGRIMSWI